VGITHCYSPLGRHPGGYIPVIHVREAPWWVCAIITVREAPWWVCATLSPLGRHPGGYVPLRTVGRHPGGYIPPVSLLVEDPEVCTMPSSPMVEEP